MIEPTSFALSARFPATPFRSFREFQAFQRDNRTSLDTKYEFETSLASNQETISRDGTCGPCLRPAKFTSRTRGGTKTSDLRLMPNWREEMRCNCPDKLINRERAVIHLLLASGLMSWMNLAVFGPPVDADRRLENMVASATRVERLRNQVTSLSSPDLVANMGLTRSSVHFVVSHDYLHFVPPLQEALDGILKILVDGGRFIFTAPFYWDQAITTMMPRELLAFSASEPVEFRGAEHRFGWDLMEMLIEAGFRDAVAYLYWSEELGYLGSMGFIFRAIK